MYTVQQLKEIRIANKKRSINHYALGGKRTSSRMSIPYFNFLLKHGASAMLIHHLTTEEDS